MLFFCRELKYRQQTELTTDPTARISAERCGVLAMASPDIAWAEVTLDSDVTSVNTAEQISGQTFCVPTAETGYIFLCVFVHNNGCMLPTIQQNKMHLSLDR